MNSTTPSWLSLTERFLACVALVLSLPLLLLVALLIRVTSGSPVLVTGALLRTNSSLTRRCLHFRTKGRGTPLFHSLGRILRSLSVDELPGFWNVARGDLSLRELLQKSR